MNKIYFNNIDQQMNKASGTLGREEAVFTDRAIFEVLATLLVRG